jgi:chromosome segregation ATPase
VSEAQASAEKLLAPDGELQKHRAAVQQLSSQALQTSASLESLKAEQAALEALRKTLRESQNDLKGATQRTEVLKGELHQLRGNSDGLAEDYGKLREAVR